MIRKKYWGSWTQSEAPILCGKWIKVAFLGQKARIHKNIKVCFQIVNIVWDDYQPQNPIPGKILILLDTHNLSVPKELPYPDLPKMAIGNGKWQIWQSPILGYFWHTDKWWVSKSIRISPGIWIWGLKSAHTVFLFDEQTFRFLWILALWL